MAELKITFQKDWSNVKKTEAIQHGMNELKGSRITRLQLVKENKELFLPAEEKADWCGPSEQAILLQKATAFLITYE